MRDDNAAIRELLGELRNEMSETRDAVMTRMGGLETATKHLSDEVQQTRQIAQRASDEARKALRQADEARDSIRSTGDALKVHVSQATRSVRDDNAGLTTKVDDVLREIQASRALGAARSQLRLEQEAERAREIEDVERRKRHVKWGIGILISVAQIIELYLLAWRHLQ